MASTSKVNDIFGFIESADKEDGQEGGSDAPGVFGFDKSTKPAIDSLDNGPDDQLIGTRDTDAIRNARLRAMKKDPDNIENVLQSAHGDQRPVVPISEQLGSMFERFGKSIAAGTGDLAAGAALSRKMVDNPEYMVDRNLDVAHMSPSELFELSRSLEGKSDEEIRNIRLDSYVQKRDEFIKGAEKFAAWMPDVPQKKTSGALGVLDEALTGMGQFAPTMVGGAVTGGSMSMPLAYMQILPGKFDQYVKDGRSEEDAFDVAQNASVALAVVEGMGTNIQLSKLGQLFKGFGKKGLKQGFLKKTADQVINNGLTEGFEEITQAELEVVFDVIAKNPDTPPEEIGKKVVDIWKSPEFQKGVGYQGLVGAVGGASMGAGAATASEIANKIATRGEKVSDGKFLVTNDVVNKSETEKPVDVAPEDGRPSVDHLMGVTGESSRDALDEDGGKLEDNDGGRAVQATLADPSPTQVTDQKQTTVAIESVLEDMQLKKSMQADKIDIVNNQNKLDQLYGLFVDAVKVEDHEEALILAEQYRETVDNQATKLENFTDSKQRRLNKDSAAVHPKELTNITVYVDDLTRKADDMVNSQAQAIRTQEAQNFMDFEGKLREDKNELKKSLMEQERKATNLKRPDSKLYRNVANLIDKDRWMTLGEFFGKAIKKDKIIETVGDLERKILREKDDVKVTGFDKAVDEATLNYLNELLVGKTNYDYEQARSERIRSEQRDPTKDTSTVTPLQERQQRIKEQADQVKAKQEEEARLAQEAQTREAEVERTTELAKRRRAVQEQQARTRGQVPPTTLLSEERTAAELEARGTEPKTKQAELDKPVSKTTTEESIGKSKIDVDQVQYQLSDEEVSDAKTQYRSAGVRYNGKVYEGASHTSVLMENDDLAQALLDTPTHLIHSKFDHGFVTHDGKFDDRMTASKKLKLKEGNYLQSESFLGPVLTAKKEQMQKDTGIEIPAFESLTLKDKMGTLEVADIMRQEMSEGRYSWLFDKTEQAGVQTVYVTSSGQFGKDEAIKRFYPDLKSKDSAVNRFEGSLRINPSTGQMTQAGGVKGLYLKANPLKGNPGGKVFINLPNITNRTKSVPKAMETVVHEHLHGLVDLATRNMNNKQKADLKKDLTDIWESIPKDYIKQTLDSKDTHTRVGAGIIQVQRDGVGELITYAMAHPEFAAWLNTIPATPRFRAKSSGVKTVWDVLVRMVAKLTAAPTKLTEVVDVLNRHLDIGIKDTRFSKELSGLSDTSNVTKDNVKQWVDELQNQSKNALDVEVFESAEEASKLLGYQPDGNVSSFWIPGSKTTPGRVGIISNRITSNDHLVSKWLHEQVGHQGLRNVFGDGALLNSFLDQAYRLFSRADKDTLNEVTNLYDIGRVNKDGTRTLTTTQKRLAAEEVIAKRSERLKPETKRGLIARFKDFLKRWLPKEFVGKADTFLLTDNDVMSVLSAAKGSVLTGDSRLGDLLKKAVQAREPRHEFRPWKTLPKFVESDETYKQWVKDVIKAAPETKRWYQQHSDTIRKVFGKDSDLFNILLAVTSPQVDVETNVAYAVKTYAYLRGAVDKPGGRFPNVIKARIDENWTTPENTLRDLESKTFKVTEFVRGLLGDTDATVGDIWMFRAFYGDPKVFGKTREELSTNQAVGMRQKLHSLAAQLSTETGDVWTPLDVQAALWTYINAKQTGKAFNEIASYQTGLNKPQLQLDGKTPVEWLQGLFPDLADGPLSQQLGLKTITLAPVSPLEKKLLQQINTELRTTKKAGQRGYAVSQDGTITITPTENKRLDTVRVMNAIVNGGRETTVNNDVTAEWLKQTFGFEDTGTSADSDTVHLKLRPDALKLFQNDQGKVTFGAIRDNLAGWSGNYTQTARFSREASKNLEQIRDMDTLEAQAEFIRSGNDGSSVLGKIHEWRDQSELNWNRFANSLEQEFLDKFGGRKSRVKVLGSGRKLNTASTELLQKAMNLYIDSGTGKNFDKVVEYSKKLEAKRSSGDLTGREREHQAIMDRMLIMSDEEIAWADSTIRPYYEDTFKFAQDHKLIDSHVDNYVKRSWQMPKDLRDADVRWSGFGTTGFTLTLDSGKKRSLDSIIDGWENGMDLKTDGVIGNLQNYGVELGYTFANRRFVDYMRGLIDFNSDAIMMEVDPKKQPDFRTPAGYVQITDRGFAKPGHRLFARKDIGTVLNKLGERPDWKFWNLPLVKLVRQINSSIKSTILSVSLFHHLAGMRSYVFAVSGKGFKINPISAYHRGLKKIDEQSGFDNPSYQHIGPVVDFLVREGLTLGKTQDWEGGSGQKSFIEDMLRARKGIVSYTVLKQWQAARRTKRSLTTGLFNRLFAGLKAESAALELGHLIKKQEKKLGRPLTDAELKLGAQQTAELINSDFGGLHLSRKGRNPNVQRVAQLLLLAPDWTESNWRTITGMVPGLNKAIEKGIGDSPATPGMEKVYRRFWKGITIRALATVALTNLAVLSLFGDDDDWEDYKNMLDEQLTWKNFHKGRWLRVNVDTVLPDSWRDPEKRRLVSVVGHFGDILKVRHPAELVKHKLSPAARFAESSVSQRDWKGSRFTTLSEMFEDGVVPKLAVDNKFVPDDSGVSAMSFLMYNARQSFPIFGSELVQALSGETTWISALGRAGGLDIRDTRREPVAQQRFEEVVAEVNKLDKNLREAQTIQDQKMIFEARRDQQNYPGFNQKKSRIGYTKGRLAHVNKKLKPLLLKRKRGIKLTLNEERQIDSLRQQKQSIYEQAVLVLER